MNKTSLPDKVDLIRATEELNMYQSSVISNLRTLLILTKSLNIPLYFNHEVYGYEVEKPLDVMRDKYTNDITGINVLEKTSSFSDTECLIALNANCYWQDARHLINISSFLHKETTYYTLDETQEWLESQSYAVDYFYIKNEDLLSLIDKLNNSQTPPPSKRTKAIPYADSESVLVALALFAREKADGDTNFQKASEVNGAAIGRHILSLAEIYNIDMEGDGNMKKIDGKINTMLRKLDLKELNKL